MNNIELNSGGGSDKTVKRLPLHPKIRIRALSDLTFNTKMAFSQLRKVFIKAQIF